MKNIEYENLALLNNSFFKEFEESFKEVLKSGWYILGDKVKKFEQEFSKYNNSLNCVGVASGLDALILSLASLNLEKESEVIVPSNTYIATILSVLQNSLKPVLVEPQIETYNIDPILIEKSITSKTKAIIIVHMYGKSCEMDKIIEICEKHNLVLIEDCAQAHGAKFNSQNVGTFGSFGAFSFYPTKNLGALGDGGAILCNESIFLDKLRKLRNYGSDRKYYNEMIGYNSRLDEIQAAFLSIKLKKLDQINAHKRKLANLYFDNLKSDYILPSRNDKNYDVFHIFNIRHEKRDKLKEFLLKNNIKTEIHYPVSPNNQTALQNYFSDQKFPISELIHSTTLSLPISFFHSEDEIKYVIDKLNSF